MEKKPDAQFLLFGAGLALVVLAAVLSLLHMHGDKPQESGPLPKSPVVQAAETMPAGYEHRASDGIPIPSDQQPTHFFAVMVENSSEAWPLSGLSKARLVFEAPVEGAIPRFMVVFDNTQQVDKIGPVRSARPYYLDWAQGLGALYAHVGGSPQALALIASRPIKDLNQFFYGQFFWRSIDRYAPHNVYTSTDLLNKGFDHRSFSEQALPIFSYIDQTFSADEAGNVTGIVVPFSSASDRYTATWQYQTESNQFLREQGGKQQFDQDGAPVVASNVLVLSTDVAVIDDEGRRSVRTLGSGQGLLFRDGKQFTVKWQKDSVDAPLKILSEADEEVALRPGPTWIEVIPTTTNITVQTNES